MHTILAHNLRILAGLPATADPTNLLRNLHTALDDLVGGNRTLALVPLRLLGFFKHWPEPDPDNNDYLTDIRTLIVDLERLRDALAHPETMWTPKRPPK